MKENYTKNTAFRTTPENFDRYKRVADSQGLTLAEWIRRVVEKEARKIEKKL